MSLQSVSSNVTSYKPTVQHHTQEMDVSYSQDRTYFHHHTTLHSVLL